MNAQTPFGTPITLDKPALQSLATVDIDKRIALVIGNNAYRRAKLTAAVNDARAVAQTLKTLRFSVTEIEDVDRLAMFRAIRSFATELTKPDTVGVFYFAGHGVQINGKNFLVPVDAEIDQQDDIEHQSVDLQYLLDKFSTIRNGMNILILDACRVNPFAARNAGGSSGLAAIDGPPGTLVAFAAAPGKVAIEDDGGNGVFTRNVLNNIKVPGLPLEEIFKRARAGVLADTKGVQVPWENTSLIRDFYFTAAPPGQGFQHQNIDSESVAWRQVEDTKNIYDIISFVRAFPNSRYAPEVLQRVNTIFAKLKPSPPALFPGELLDLLTDFSLGVGLRPLNRYAAELYSFKADRGLVISEVIKGSTADRAGVRVGDIPLSVGGQPVPSFGDFRGLGRIIRAGESFEAVVWRSGREMKVSGTVQRASIEQLIERIGLLRFQSKDYGRAIQFYDYLASIEDSHGQTMLGTMYLAGLGTSKDISAAESWFTKAASQGNSLAAYLLAEMYLDPKSGLSKPSEAFRFAKMAADAGHPGGAANLARTYLIGVGTERDGVEAMKWSRVAAMLGDARGMFLLGSGYLQGIGGLTKSTDDAKEWLKRSSELNYAPAKTALQKLGN